jgi:hypothetical protein
VRIIARPGSQYIYSGGGYEIVQLMLEQQEKQALPAIVKRLVLAPLRMDRTSYLRPIDGNAASAHDVNGKRIGGGWRLYPELAAAGIWTTPSDLAKVLIALDDAYSGRRHALLKPSTIRSMMQPQAPSPYGLGFETSGTGNAFRIGHGGGGEGFKAQYWLYPTTGDGAVVMTNGERGWSLVLEILRSISAAYGWADFKPDHRTRVTLSASALQLLAGTFRPAGATSGDALVVTVDGDHPLMKAPFGIWHMLPASPRDFFDTDTSLTATFDQNGRQLSAGGMTFMRQP